MPLIIVAALLAFLGWLIRYKKVTGLISGYNTAPKKKKAEYDVDKMCRSVGTLVFVLAGILAITGLAMLLTNNSLSVAFTGLGALLLAALGGIIWLNTGGRLKKQ